MNNKKTLTLIYVFFLSYYLIVPGNAMEEEDFYNLGRQGFTSYTSGEYKKAASLFKQALENGDFTFAMTYADICQRNLDGEEHLPEEAARWYVKAAETGDGEALSYLRSMSEQFVTEMSTEKKIEHLIHLWANQEANRGCELYQNGEFSDAAKLLKRASQKYHTFAQELYGDICKRQLDGEPHSYYEAASWYLLSALGGNSETFSYLKSLGPGLLNDENYDTQMKNIVSWWAKEDTLPCLKKIKPGQVNKYIMYKHKRIIDKTTSQKLPYLFERAFAAILCDIKLRPFPVMDDSFVPQGKEEVQRSTPQSCRLADQLANQKNAPVGHRTSPFSFGPVYANYYKKLKTEGKLDAKGNLIEPKEGVQIDFLYQLLLDSIHEVCPKDYAASKLSNISHDDYPWLWAGIKYWKDKNDQKPFSFTSLSEDELIKRLTEFSFIPASDINTIRRILEEKHLSSASERKNNSLWPNEDRSDTAKKYNELLHKYFTTSLSQNAKIIDEIKQKFYEKLKNLMVDCSKDEELEILRLPFLMFYCDNLELMNISHSKPFYNALTNAQRYFVELNLTISFSSDFKKNSKIGKNIEKLISVIYKRGVNVIYK